MQPLLLILMMIVCYSTLKVNDASPISVSIDTVNGVHAVIIGQQIDGVGVQFLGIRYAQTPVGARRFQNAVRLDPSGNISAIAYAPHCVQTLPPYPSGSIPPADQEGEDCLGLNIWTPTSATPSSKLSVLVWLHSGALEVGNAELLVPGIFNNLVNRGPLIIVSVNYRLGPFGFFSSRDSAIPGNAGFSDQIEALLWVRRYISFFGGDPNQVTLGGQSSGAESVSALTLTSATAGLFQRVILQSGTAFGTGHWSYSEDTRNTSRQLAIGLNCTTDAQWAASTNRSAIVDCIRRVSVADLQAANAKMTWNGNNMYDYKWGPVQDPILFPVKIESAAAARRPVNVLGGVCNAEWVGPYESKFQANGPGMDYFTLQNVTNEVTQAYNMRFWDNPAKVINATVNYYFNSVNASQTDHVVWALQGIKAWGDIMNTGPLLRDMGYYAANGAKQWLYSFDYLSPNALTFVPASIRGVPHAWDLQYMEGTAGWGDPQNHEATAFTPSSVDIALQNDLFGPVWSNFVVYGDPMAKRVGLLNSISSWPTFNFSSRPYLSIQPQPKVGLGFHPSAVFIACTAPAIDGRKPAFCP